MTQIEKRKKRKLITIFIILAFIVSIIIFSHSFLNKNSTSGGVKWEGNQTISHNTDTQYIAIPGVSKMYFNKDSLHQNVNIYNPDQNKCTMNFKIVVDDEIIWSEENVYPGYGFYSIDILHTMVSGVYDANLIIDCYSIETGMEANGGALGFKLYVS